MHSEQLVHPIEPPQMTLAALPWSGVHSRRFRRLKSVFVPPPAHPAQSQRHARSSSFPRRVLSSESTSSSLASIVQMIAAAHISQSSPSSSSSCSFSRGLVSFSVQSCLGRRPLQLELPLWSSVKDVKHAIEASERNGGGGGVPAARLRIFYCGREWDNARTLHDLNLADGDVVYAVVVDRRGLDGQVQLKARGSFVDAEETPLLRQCRQGLLTGLVPQLTLEGSGGTYCLRNARKVVVGMFKPSDEEPFAPNNPRGHTGQLGYAGFRRGVRSGEAALREVAASLLDHDGFSGVPFTTLVELAHPTLNWPSSSTSASGSTKIGSLQQFVSHDELAGDLAPQSFPVGEVHKIGILDLRILNVDRNDSNILIVRPRGSGSAERSGPQLVPIDHGYSFPRLLEVGWCDWVWLGWPQANVPFDCDTLKYIAAIDIAADHQMLRSRLGINELALRNARISTMLLQIGAAAGLTLFDIGSLASRGDLEQPSMLEIVTAQAEALSMEPPALRRSVSDGLVATQTHSGVASQTPLCSCDRDARQCACDTLQDEGVPAADLPLDLESFWSHIEGLLRQLVVDYSRNHNIPGFPSLSSSSSTSSSSSSSCSPSPSQIEV